MRTLTVLSVLSGSVLSVKGLESLSTEYKCTHYRKNKDHTYHGNYYFVCFPDVPLISTLSDSGWEKNVTFGCAILGENNCTIGYNSFAIGKDTATEGNYSIALGYNAKARNNNAFAWSAVDEYVVSGNGHFGINPKNGISGFFIGNSSLKSILDTSYKVDVDDELISTSTNPVQNKVITSAFNELSNLIGDINSLLDVINGETI